MVCGLVVACDAAPKCRTGHAAACSAPGAGGADASARGDGGAAGGGGAESAGDGGAESADDGGSWAGLAIPALPFLVGRFADPGEQFCAADGGDCQVGPWLMAFAPGAQGELEGALVASGAWPAKPTLQGLREAAAFRLFRSADDVYRLEAGERATLATYSDESALVPGVCLHNDAKSASELRFLDTNGDNLADTLTLSGTVVTEGLVSSDYEGDCGSEMVSVELMGRVTGAPIQLAAQGNAMHATLQVDGGLLKSGKAQVLTEAGWTNAEPLLVSGLIYGFKVGEVLPPAATLSSLSWRVIGGVDLGGGAVAELERNFGPREAWPLAGGDFDNLHYGEQWNKDLGSSSAEPHCSRCSDDPEQPFPPITGRQSLLIQRGGEARFRLKRSADQTRLKLLAFGKLAVELGAVGSAPFTPPLAFVAADCAAHVDFCNAAPPESLREYTVDLPTGEGDVLLRIWDRTPMLGVTDGTGVWLDDLRLE